MAARGECGIEDGVRLEAVFLRDKTRVALTPPAIVRCTFAEAIVQWVREDLAPAVRNLGAPLRSLDNYAAYYCRGRNRIVGAKLSEHGKANAIDIRSVKLANGIVVGLTDPQVGKDLRLGLRKSTCARFTTVLGPGSEAITKTTCMWTSPSEPAATVCASGTCASPARSLWRRCRCRCPGRHPPTMTTKTDRS